MESARFAAVVTHSGGKTRLEVRGGRRQVSKRPQFIGYDVEDFETDEEKESGPRQK